MNLERISAADIERSWHECGSGKGSEPLYFRALKLGKVKVKVRWETGSEGWMCPAAFDKVVSAEATDFVQWK